jgi:hypothetical protein
MTRWALNEMGREFDAMFPPARLDSDDPLAPARGTVRAVAASIIIWLVICLTLAVMFA